MAGAVCQPKKSGEFQALTHLLCSALLCSALLCSALLFHNLVYAKIDFLFRLLFSQRVSHPVGEAPVYPMAVPVFIKLLG